MILDRIVQRHDQLISAISERGWQLVANFYEGDVAATEPDDELAQEQFLAELFNQPYDGPTPNLVRHYSQRWVIPWSFFTAHASRLPTRRRRQ